MQIKWSQIILLLEEYFEQGPYSCSIQPSDSEGKHVFKQIARLTISVPKPNDSEENVFKHMHTLLHVFQYPNQMTRSGKVC